MTWFLTPQCRGFPVDRFDNWQTSAAYFGLGLHWGLPQAQNAKGHIICHIKVWYPFQYSISNVVIYLSLNYI